MTDAAGTAVCGTTRGFQHAVTLETSSTGTARDCADAITLSGAHTVITALITFERYFFFSCAIRKNVVGRNECRIFIAGDAMCVLLEICSGLLAANGSADRSDLPRDNAGKSQFRTTCLEMD